MLSSLSPNQVQPTFTKAPIRNIIDKPNFLVFWNRLTLSWGENRIRTKTSGRASCPADWWRGPDWRRIVFRRRRPWSSSPGSGNSRSSSRPKSMPKCWPSEKVVGKPNFEAAGKPSTSSCSRNPPDRPRTTTPRRRFVLWPNGRIFEPSPDLFRIVLK